MVVNVRPVVQDSEHSEQVSILAKCWLDSGSGPVPRWLEVTEEHHGRCDTAERGSHFGVRQTSVQVLASPLMCCATWELTSPHWASVSSPAKWNLQRFPQRAAESLVKTICTCSWHRAWHSE